MGTTLNTEPLGHCALGTVADKRHTRRHVFSVVDFALPGLVNGGDE